MGDRAMGQDASVFATKPVGNNLKINSVFDGIAAKEMAASVIAILGQAGMVAGGRNHFASVTDLKHPVFRLWQGWQVFPHGKQ